jgi:hypothetical protein
MRSTNTATNQPTKTLLFLTTLIALLALIAAGLGVQPAADAETYPFTSIRGETVEISGHPLYTYDSVSIVAQAVAQDWVTLLLGIPLLVVGGWMTRHGRLRGRLLLTGTLGYFLYTYASYAFGSAFNVLFLVYVALFSLSLFAFTIGMMQLPVDELAASVSPRLPRRGISLFCLPSADFCCWPGWDGWCRRFSAVNRRLGWRQVQRCSFRC